VTDLIRKTPMHNVHLPQNIIDRLIMKRGKVEIFDSLDPARTALVVIDMQNAFVAEGAALEVPAARGIVHNINELAAASRETGAAVVWVRITLAASGPNAFPVYHQNFFSPEKAAKHQAALAEGSDSNALYPELDVQAKDTIIDKNRFSAMIDGSSDLEKILRDRGIDTVIITGTLSNICCEATARDAMMLGFKVVFVSDGNAALSDDEHLASMVTIAQGYGDVRTCDETISILRAGAAAVKRPGEAA
jgi:ureidoacrylate peracid hydrolase